MNLSVHKVDRKFAAFSILILSAAIVLSYLFPYSGDDWAWGSSIGMERLVSWFKDYNGRYAGNLLVMLLTRCKLLDVIFKAVSLYCVCVFPYFFIKNKKFISLVFATLFVFLMPKQIFSQSFVWTSGYSNYVPSILLAIVYILMILNVFEDEKPKYPKFYPIVTAALGFVGSLFMENITIYNDVLAALVILYCYIKFKEFYITHIGYLVGSVLGTIVMFSNGAYRLIASADDSYRSTAASDGLKNTLFSNGDIISTQLFLNNLPILTAITVMCIIIGLIYIEKNKDKDIDSFNIKCISVSSFVNLLTLILLFYKKYYSHWKISTDITKSDNTTIFLVCIIVAIYLLSVLVQVIVCIKSKHDRDKLVFLLLSIAIIVAPLFVVNPIGSRCFFPPYVFMVIFSAYLFNYILSNISFSSQLSRYLSFTISAGVLASFIFLISMYVPIYYYSNIRDEYIKKQIDKGYQEVVVCKLPYPSYVWIGDPEEELWEYRYKIFNDIDENINFDFKTYKGFNKWKTQYDKAN